MHPYIDTVTYRKSLIEKYKILSYPNLTKRQFTYIRRPRWTQVSTALPICEPSIYEYIYTVINERITYIKSIFATSQTRIDKRHINDASSVIVIGIISSLIPDLIWLYPLQQENIILQKTANKFLKEWLAQNFIYNL